MRALVVALAVLVAGCAETSVVPRASAWEWNKEPSMYSDFTGKGDGYPVLLVHSHTTMSVNEREYYEQNPVVCLLLTEERALPDAGRDATAPAVADRDATAPAVAGRDMVDAVSCDPPRHDPAAGRLFVERQTFDEWAADALVIREGCGSMLTPLDAATPGFRLRTPEHDFEVRWDDGVFRVDGQVLRPGEAFRITYWIDRGDPDDEKMVRVVLDYPGQWLRSLVGPAVDEPPMPIDPTRASGLQVHVPTHLGTLPDIIDRVAAAMPSPPSELAALRVVYGAGGLRDIHLALGDGTTTVTWYLASRDDEGLRLLGNVTPAAGAGMLLERFTTAFAGPLADYGATADAVSVVTQWTPQWSVKPSLLQGVPTPCRSCLYAWGDGLGLEQGWQPDPLATRADAHGALSLHVTAVAADGTVQTALYAR